VLRHQAILPREIAFRKTEIMNRINQVGLPNAVFSTNANDALRKNKVFMEVVLELEKRYGIDEKAQARRFKAQDYCILEFHAEKAEAIAFYWL
jgi:hypothetical protein